MNDNIKWVKNRIGLAFMEHEQGETDTAISMIIDCIKVIVDELGS